MAVRRNLLNELNAIGLYTIIRVGEGRKQAPQKGGEPSPMAGVPNEDSSVPFIWRAVVLMSPEVVTL